MFVHVLHFSPPAPLPSSPLSPSCPFSSSVPTDLSFHPRSQDIAKLASHLADDFTHQIWPTTVRMPTDGDKRLSKEIWIGRMQAYHDGWIENVGVSTSP